MPSVIQGFGHAAVTAPSSNLTTPAHQVVVIGDGEGNILGAGGYPAVQLPSQAQAAGNSETIATAAFSSLAIDINVTAFTGGTSPSVTFTLARVGSDGVAYPVWSSGAISSASKMSASIGAGFTGGTGGQGAGGFPVALTASAIFAWTFAGAPTSVTFSASVVGH